MNVIWLLFPTEVKLLDVAVFETLQLPSALLVLEVRRENVQGAEMAFISCLAKCASC